MQTCVIFNPSARGEKAAALRAHSRSLWPDAIWQPTLRPAHARELAAAAVREGFTTVIAAGGDGTVHEVLNGIADAPGGLERTKFGVLPMGTVNVFARELGFPRRLPDVIALLRTGRTERIDLGHAGFIVDGKPAERFFAQLAGAGLDSRAIELVSWEWKKKIGAAAYIAAGFRAMNEKKPAILVQSDELSAGELVLIGNGRFYGGGWTVFPRASLQDGSLHFCVLPKATWRQVAAAGFGLLTGHFQKFSSALHLRAASAKLSSPGRVLLQLDGENVGELPATLSVRPRALQVIVR